MEAGGERGLRQRAVADTMASAGTLPSEGVRVGRMKRLQATAKHGGDRGRVLEDDYFVLLTFPQFLLFTLVLLLAYATGGAALAAD
jgi:hypothetical protein